MRHDNLLSPRLVLMWYRQSLTTPVFGPGVVYDCPNHVLMEQKKFVKYGLSTDNFRAYVGMIEDEITTFINNDPAFSTFQDKKSTEWGTFQAFKTCSEMTIFTASRTLQGSEIRAALDKSFADLYHDLDNGFTPINLLMPNVPLPSSRRRDTAQKAMSDFYVNIIQRRRVEGRMVSSFVSSAVPTSSESYPGRTRHDDCPLWSEVQGWACCH